MKPIVIAVLFLTPYLLKAQESVQNLRVFFKDGKPNVTWTHPGTPKMFNYGSPLLEVMPTGSLAFRDGEGYIGAVAFDSADIQQLNLMQKQVGEVVFYAGDSTAAYTVKIWKGAHAESLVYSKRIGRCPAGWFRHELSDSVRINGPIRLGVEVDHGYAKGPLTRDNGPHVAAKSNLIYFRNEWKQMTDFQASFTYNWSIGGFTKSQVNDPLYGFEIYRLYASDTALSHRWTLLSQGQGELCSYVDTSFYSVVSDTIFRYALRIIYDGKPGPFRLTPEFQKRTQPICNPSKLHLSQQIGGVLMTWEMSDVSLSEDVESQEGFDGNNLKAWKTYDVDGDSTYFIGVGENTVLAYPGAGAPSGFFTLDAAYQDKLPEILQPHSGTKIFGSLATRKGAMKNNDWLVSPNLLTSSPNKVTFWARAASNAYGLESFKVLYSTTSDQISDFKAITSVEVKVDTAWTLFTYELPAQVTYFAINCISADKYLFLVDDIEFHTEAEARYYDLYVDDVLDSSGVQNRFYTFKNLGPQTYTLGVKAIFDDGDSSELMTIVYDGSSVPNARPVTVQRVQVYPNPSSDGHVFMDAQYAGQWVEVYDLQGRLIRKIRYQTSGLDLSDCHDGIYLFFIEGRQYGGKILIRRK